VFDGSDGEPVITHKMTMIRPILLRDAIRAINTYAFVASPYPLILTIENQVSVLFDGFTLQYRLDSNSNK
jgi:phosphatidylinositol phospholipase C delta